MLIRSKLQKIGYFSPYLKNPVIELVSSPSSVVKHQEEYMYKEFNGVQIRQRVSDGKLDATAMASVFGKLLSNWLRTDQTWDLFAAKAQKEGVEINYAYKHNSVNTRVTDAFPTLIERKAGSPANGGGTFISYELAVNLAQWLDPQFGLFVVELVVAWLDNKALKSSETMAS